MNCYNCGDDLTDANRSEEHIINNSLGGHLTSFDVLCSACNNEFGHSLDAEIDGQIGMFADLAGAKRHRDSKYRQIKIEMISDNGEVKYVGKKMRPLHELFIDTGTAQFTLSVPEDRYERLKLAKKREMIKKFKVKDNEYIKQPDKTRWHVKNSKSDKNGNIAFGGYDYFRGLSRICLNYYLSKGYPIKYAGHLLAFVQGKIEFNDLVYFYYPRHYLIYELANDEISHIIHIKGDKKTGLLYAYLELFNFQNILVIINKQYDGPDINDTYCYDLINGVEDQKKAMLRLFRHHIDIMHLIEEDTPGEHLIRYNRFQRIIEKNQLKDE